jgi:hypothetical protein
MCIDNLQINTTPAPIRVRIQNAVLDSRFAIVEAFQAYHFRSANYDLAHCHAAGTE